MMLCSCEAASGNLSHSQTDAGDCPLFFAFTLPGCESAQGCFGSTEATFLHGGYKGAPYFHLVHFSVSYCLQRKMKSFG